MSRRFQVLAFAAATVLELGVAEAKIFDVYAQAQGGAAAGKGLGGAQKDADFFDGATPSGAYGVLVGAEVLFIDGWVEHIQLNDGSLTGTWTRIMVGLDVDFALGDGETDDQGKEKPPTTFAELGVGIGFGMGTGQQVEPPLDNAQISDKGFVAQVTLGVDRKLGGLMSIGLAVPIAYGYLFKNDIANDQSNHYHTLHVTPQVYLRLHIGK
jgi:hypothetical protein